MEGAETEKIFGENEAGDEEGGLLSLDQYES